MIDCIMKLYHEMARKEDNARITFTKVFNVKQSENPHNFF
jgi:hypothetical protein